MSAPLDGRTALVTGAGAGIGEAVARAFVAAGAHVTVADVNSDAAQRVAGEIGGTPWVVDLTNTATWPSCGWTATSWLTTPASNTSAPSRTSRRRSST